MKANQREALLGAMLDELTAKGYDGASVEDAMRMAGVSPADFATEFKDKDECLYAAYDHVTEQMLAKVSGGCRATEPWPDRIRSGLMTLLSELASRPRMAQAITRSFPGIRPSAYQRYVQLLSRFEPFMEEGREYSEVEEELPGEVELLAVGAAEAIIFGEVDAGHAERLPAMMPEILFSVLVPFMGPDRAADEMRSASAAI